MCNYFILLKISTSLFGAAVDERNSLSNFRVCNFYGSFGFFGLVVETNQPKEAALQWRIKCCPVFCSFALDLFETYHHKKLLFFNFSKLQQSPHPPTSPRLVRLYLTLCLAQRKFDPFRRNMGSLLFLWITTKRYIPHILTSPS